MPDLVRPSDVFTFAYEAAVPAAMALTPERLRPKAVDVMNFMSVVLRAQGNIASLRERFVHHQFDVVAFDSLRTVALAMGYAHMTHAPFTRGVDPSETADLTLGRHLRDHAAFETAICVKRGVIPASKFDAITTGPGYDNTGRALINYCHVLRPYTAQMEEACALRVSDLDTMQMLGERLIVIGGDRKVPDHTAAAATADMLLRMFTLTEHAYTQVRHGLAYLFRDTPEQVRLLAPTVQQMRASASTPGVVASPTAKSEDAPSEERSAAE